MQQKDGLIVAHDSFQIFHTKILVLAWYLR